MKKLFTTEKLDDIIVIRFSFEEIDLEQRDILKKELDELLEKDGNRFLMDLARVGFVSSVLISVIISFSKKVAEKNGKLKFCGLSQAALNVFHLTKLDKAFELYETEHDALESFKKV